MSRIHTAESMSKLLDELKQSYQKSGFEFNVSLTSGFFDPIHSGHISYLKNSSRLGNIWIAALNDNQCCLRKKGFYFLDEQERANILVNLKWVHYCVIWSDDDVSNLIELIKPQSFANGGDRTIANKNEDRACRAVGCKQLFGVGGNIKTQASSNILKDFLGRYQEGYNITSGQ